jgi:hypothetical protein
MANIGRGGFAVGAPEDMIDALVRAARFQRVADRLRHPGMRDLVESFADWYRGLAEVAAHDVATRADRIKRALKGEDPEH